jgi:hypothetical protein
MADLLTSCGLSALTDDPPRFAVLYRAQRSGARWRKLGTFGSQSAANKFAVRAMDGHPRCDWQVRCEPADLSGRSA